MEFRFWTNITGYDDWYIANTGHVKRGIDGKIKKTWMRNGYPAITINRKPHSIHRLVALHFIELVPGKNIVNHKDGDRTNCHEDNLEWCTLAENAKHATDTKLAIHPQTPVGQYDTKGKLIATYNSIKEASDATGASSKHIPSVCTGKRKSAGGYIWRHITNRETEIPKGEVIDGFPNYIVTNSGKIYNTKTKREMIPMSSGAGYHRVTLSNNGATKTFLIHRLVAQAYLPRIKGKDVVNHKDFNHINNDVSNLEWCTQSENMKHSAARKVVPMKKVAQYDAKGNKIATFESINNAAKHTNVDASSIVKVCNKKAKHAGGYLWEYIK